MTGPSTAQSEAAAGSPKVERLALLYEGILTAIVRVQSGRQQIQGPDVFRGRMKEALKDIAQVAARRGYTKDMVEEASFAVVAFLDETVMSSQEEGRTQWARKSLQEELFQQRSAGELFFKHLDELRAHHDSSHLAEVLEIYYLCLLLGYEGRYAAGSRAELYVLMDNIRERIERILGSHTELSPDWRLPESAPVLAAPNPFFQQLRMAAIAAAVLAFLCFCGFSCHLSNRTADIDHAAERQVAR